jgi:hypothetical protein
MTRFRSIRIVLGIAALLGSTLPAAAQTEGRIGIGGTVTVNNTTDSDVGTALTVGPLVRLNPRPGWGFAGGFNWYWADLHNPAGGDDDFARLSVKPFMGGIGYTMGPPKTLVNFSIVMGPSFNRAYFEDNFVDAAGSSIEAKTSFAVRPGISITQTLAPRVGVTAYGGYMINRPDVTYRSNTGQQVQDRWRADSIVLSVGMV